MSPATPITNRRTEDEFNRLMFDVQDA